MNTNIPFKAVTVEVPEWSSRKPNKLEETETIPVIKSKFELSKSFHDYGEPLAPEPTMVYKIKGMPEEESKLAKILRGFGFIVSCDNEKFDNKELKRLIIDI